MIETKEGLTFEVVPSNASPITLEPLFAQMRALMKEGILADDRIDTPGVQSPVSEILFRLFGAYPTYQSRHYGVICDCGKEVIHKTLFIYPFSIRASRCDGCGTVYLRKYRIFTEFFGQASFEVMPDLPLWDHPIPYAGTIKAIPVEATKEAISV